MDVLWRVGPASVSEVLADLSDDVDLAYSSVLTTLRILETKGYVRHRKQGRAFIYEPVVDQQKARENAVTALLKRFFENSPEQLVLNLIDGRKMSARELQRLRKRIAEAEQ